MKNLILLAVGLLCPSFSHLAAADAVSAARGVLIRTLGETAAAKLELKISPELENGYRFRADGGILHVEGSSAVALCRGAYDYLRSQGMGMVGWEGARLQLPATWPDAPNTEGSSPFPIRHCYNAVTSGYTQPYWDWARWEQELDWLAMHGYNMVMNPVAFEAMLARVWKDLGLTDDEIAQCDTGPAHLPWMRMGCIENVSGDLTEAWHSDQIALEKKFLARMRELGIEPVVQGFAGFVPKGMKRLHPEVKFHETHWNGGFPMSQRPIVMLPDTPLWTEIMNRYMAEWKREFGEARYWLVDSFNELQLPKTDEPPAEMLARYGKTTFEAIRAGDPDAVWVLQGWMFNYQRNIWNKDTVKALVEAVPANDLLVLDYANDYNPNWDDFSAFHGRSWVMGYVQNMGGKTAFTGKMDFYANQVANTLARPEAGNLVGFTISGEGLENNQVLYELMSDTAWSREAIKLDAWLPEYAANRYGSDDPGLAGAWLDLRKSVYSSFTPHPSFGWQKMNFGHGSVYRGAEFPATVQRFLAVAEQHGKQANYRDDAVEMAAQALGLRADDWFALARDAHSQGDSELFEQAVNEGCGLLLQADQLLESHSYLRLAYWLDFTKKHGGSEEQKVEWEHNARHLITTWGPPVNDYSCRVWSGLIRDFYVPRLRAMARAMAAGEGFNRHPWEAAWVNATGISPVEILDDPAGRARDWVRDAYAKSLLKLSANDGETLATWEPGVVTGEWKQVEWPLNVELLQALAGVRFQFTGGHHRLDIREVSLVGDGKVIATDRHDGSAGDQHVGTLYHFQIPAGSAANNSLVLRAEVRSLKGANSRGKIIAIPKKD